MPTNPKIYHIVHINRLSSIITGGYLWCDREAMRRGVTGTTIGMGTIKERRLNELTLRAYPDLHVGDCVPFYFCPRSVMLYVIHLANHPELAYRGGQGPIIHLEADLYDVVAWANAHKRQWAFTTSNAGAYYFEDYRDLDHLNKIDWNAVAATQWADVRESKQSEFLIEQSFPWELVSRIGVLSNQVRVQVMGSFPVVGHCPRVEIRPDWYY